MNLKTKISSAVALATLLGSGLTAMIGGNEGRALVAYQDVTGTWTICDGETAGVKAGQKATQAQCNAMTAKGIDRHAEALSGLPEDLPDTVIMGALDFTYNGGIAAMRGSSQYKCLMKHDYACASKAVLNWRYVTVKGKKFDCSTPGNKVCYGLWKRRLWESKALGNQYKTVQEALADLPK